MICEARRALGHQRRHSNKHQIEERVESCKEGRAGRERERETSRVQPTVVTTAAVR